jgi:hypothetical protein
MTKLPPETTMQTVAEWLREQFPSALSVSLLVTCHDHMIATTYHDKENGKSMHALNGEWIIPEGNAGGSARRQRT